MAVEAKRRRRAKGKRAPGWGCRGISLAGHDATLSQFGIYSLTGGPTEDSLLLERYTVASPPADQTRRSRNLFTPGPASRPSLHDATCTSTSRNDLARTMADKTPCFTLVADEGDLGYQTQDLRAALEKGTDELKLDTLRRIIVSTLNGQPHVSLRTPARPCPCAIVHTAMR